VGDIYSSLPPMFRPPRGSQQGHEQTPSADSEKVPISEGPQQHIPDLDSRTLAEHFDLEVPPYASIDTINDILADAMLDGRVDPEAVTSIHEQVVALVHELEWQIATGSVERQVRLVHGRPLADWLALDDVARVLRAGESR
jgi:hypothetical protein